MLNHLRLYAVALALLAAVAFTEKALFALYHDALRDGLSTGEWLGALLWGLRFDLAIGAALALLAYAAAYLLFRLSPIGFRSALAWATFTAGTVLALVHGADLLYFEETGRHLGYELTEWYNSGAALAGAAFGTYAAPLALQGALIGGVFVLSRRVFRPAGTAVRRRRRSLWPEAQLLAVVVASVILVRGGLQSVPLEPLHAQQIGDARRAALALNGAYNALFSSVTPYAVQRVLEAPPTAEDEVRVRALYRGAEGRPLSAAAKEPPNVVVILLESWAAGRMSAYGYAQPTTPEFARLRSAGLSPPGMLADGLRTTEGIFSTFCSAQNPLGGTVAQTQLQNYDYDCLPELLRARGYRSAFFQGSLRNTSGTGAFAQLLGFEESYGKEEMPPPRLEPNSWGQHDPDIYRFAQDWMRRQEGPLLVGINTNTTHDRHLPPGVKPRFGHEDRLSGYLSALHFADAALGEFVAAVESDPTIGETLFVILADHTGSAPPSAFQRHFIPFTLYAPSRLEPRRVERIASQRDVAPTLLELLGMPVPGWFTGKSLLRDDEGPYFADFYHGGQLGWVENGRLAVTSVRNPATLQCYNQPAATERETPSACDREALAMGERAMAFTRVFQQLLFSGRVRDFASYRHPDDRPPTPITD